MYLGSDRMYYFAGENVVQDFNNTTPAPQRSSFRDSYNDNAYHPSKTVQIRDPEVLTRSPPPRASTMRNTYNDPPQDLGENFVKVLLTEYKRVRHINTKDPKVLLDFWKMNRKTRKNEDENMNKSMRGTVRSEKSFVSQGSQTSERLRDLQAIAKEREEDVAYTLDIHAEVLKQEENMKKFIMDAYRQKKMEESMKKTQKPKKMSKETLDRLYQPPKPKEDRNERVERPKTAQIPRPRTAQPTTQEAEDYDKDFAKRLVELHAEARPTERRHVDQDRLLAFWQGMPNKHDNKMNKREEIVREDIHKYFCDKYDRIQDAYETKYGYKTFDHKILLNFYKNELAENEKKRREIDFDPITLEKPLEKYCAKRKKEHEEFEQKEFEAKRKRHEEERVKLSKVAIKKEIKATGLDNLAKPKDSLIKGKTMLFLKKMFPNDRILQRMIISEFKRNKLLKYPEEYDIYDSEDEMETYQRDEQKEPYKSAAKEGRLLRISDFTKTGTQRERVITEPFKRQLEQKYLDSNLKLENTKNEKNREGRQEKMLDRFIAARVRRYLQMRKKRLDQKIPTLKEFLIQSYREMHQLHKEATERKYPHITYGYSKRLKKNSYPLEFKRDFFVLVRAISRGTKMSHGKRLLPFWAPPSAGSKSHVFLDTNKSYNKRINELSRETKIKKIEEDYDRGNCWQKDEFFDDRLNIMMTLGDAKECTFTPNVGTRMPNQYKDLMLAEYGAWANQFLTSSKSSFDEWVNAMGTNMTKRFPTIYKYGRFKRAVRFWKEEQYIKAYKEIAETFNINQIKKYFNPTFDPSKFKSVMYSPENLKLETEGHKPQEDFNDEPNKRFLEDVYILLMFLEGHEKDVKKSIKEIENRAAQDKMRARTRSLLRGSKTLMCPLGDECSDDIRPRWPASSIKTISKFGHKCEFAHHTFELKFKQEVKAQQKLLNKTLGELNKKLEIDIQKPPFNPGGNVFKGCIGCGEELRTKGVSKGICSSCQLRKSVNKKLQTYRQKAATRYLTIVKKDSFKEHYKEKHEMKEQLTTKLGYYRKACVLYDTERYRDAFNYIAKAVEMVKEEKREEEDKEQKKSDDLKAKLGIDPSVVITLDMLYEADKTDNLESSRSGDTHFGLTKAKLIAYAEKMGYIGDQKVDVNEFLNYQIQEIYLKIEKALQGKVKDIDRMQKKIEKLEGFEEDVEEKMAKQQAEGMTKSLSAISRQQRALKKKNKFDIDMVGDEKKIENLQKTIKYIKDEIEESRPPEPWRPTRSNNIILDIDKYDKMAADKKPKKSQIQKPKDLSQTFKEEKEKTKSIYNRDLEELVKPPNERSSPMKY